LWQVVGVGPPARGFIVAAVHVKPVENLSMLLVNLGSRMAVLGSDEYPKVCGDARRCDG